MTIHQVSMQRKLPAIQCINEGYLMGEDPPRKIVPCGCGPHPLRVEGSENKGKCHAGVDPMKGRGSLCACSPNKHTLMHAYKSDAYDLCLLSMLRFRSKCSLEQRECANVVLRLVMELFPLVKKNLYFTI